MNKSAFYKTVRTKLGSLKISQVEGFETILAAMLGSPLAYQAWSENDN